MEQSFEDNSHEHFINILQSDAALASFSHENVHDDPDGLHYDNRPPTSTEPPASQSSSTLPNFSVSRIISFNRRGDTFNRPSRRSPFNSVLWISIELVVNVSQIIAAIVVLSSSGHEHPQTPLFAWVVGYTGGCIASLPHLYWRYVHRNNRNFDQELDHSHQSSPQFNFPESISYATVSSPHDLGEDSSSSIPAVSQSIQSSVIVSSRLHALFHRFKTALDCFFAVWFVVGNVWIFGGHSFELSAPKLYRLCIVFLTFSFIGYALPFILCTTVCCCLPCIISVLGIREDSVPTRGATTEVINALPTYKFKPKRSWTRVDTDHNSKFIGEGGILAAGTEKECLISAEDAGCCICLAKYTENDELRKLPCSHFFHMECVDKWLKINALCPLCKTDVGDSSNSVFAYLSRRHRNWRLGHGTNSARISL